MAPVRFVNDGQVSAQALVRMRFLQRGRGVDTDRLWPMLGIAPPPSHSAPDGKKPSTLPENATAVDQSVKQATNTKTTRSAVSSVSLYKRVVIFRRRGARSRVWRSAVTVANGITSAATTSGVT